ncbi:MAG TPA: beta-1,6-glucan synthase [Methylophilaceae bacterium]|jgi:exo-beta-1,3-glucanase (GH17 family)
MPDQDNQHNIRSLWRYSCFNLFLLVLLGAWFWQQNQPVALPEIKLNPAAKLQCVSYSPYYGKEQTPLVKDTRITTAQIDHDLALLSQHFQCVRIYSVSQGLDYVPEAASRLGLKVMLGAWIGWVKTDNDKELKLATTLANRYPNTVTALIVGNEVLLRGEQTEAAMQDYLRTAKRATKIPVTYADVWEFWLKHRDMEKSVDFVTVHVLPYWEDDPQSINHASQHIATVMDMLSKSFTKPLFIGETGWPTQGRQRAGSIPSQLNQARYMREFIQLAQAKDWHYNLIEAIDQPWKRKLEGTVGGYWGLYSTGLEAKFYFNGSVAERHDGWRPLCWALLGIFAFGGLALATGKHRPSNFLSAASLGALVATVAFLQLGYLAAACRDTMEWAVLGSVALAGWLALTGLQFMLLTNFASPAKNKLAKIAMYSGLLVLIIGAAIAGWLQMTDGRYRDFPLVIYALPALQLSLGAWLTGIQIRTGWNIIYSIFIYVCGAVALVTAAIAVWREPNNLAAILWLGLSILLASALWPNPDLQPAKKN